MKNELQAHIEALNAKTEAWVAADPKNRWAGMLVTDLAHWAEYGISTPAQFDHYMLVVDVHEAIRSLYGYKPSWAGLMAMSDADLKLEAEYLRRVAREEQDAEIREERIHAERTAEAMNHKTGFSIGEIAGIP